MKKKNIALVSLCTLIGGFVSGCGNDTSNSSKDNGKVKLQISTWANETEAKEFDKIINDLNSKSDDYELKQIVIPQDYYTKIQTMIAGNTAPDLMWLAQEYIPAYAKNGAVTDISDSIRKQEIIDMNDYLSGPLDTAKWEDKLYGLPWISQPYVVFYNKTMFQESGLSEPEESWTWDKFQEISRKLTTDSTYGFANTGSVPSAVFAWGEDSDLISKDGKPLVNSEKTKKGLTTYYNISSDNTATMPYEEANSLGVEQGFINGKIGMMVGGANDDIEKKVEEAGGDFEVGMAMMPAGSKSQATFNWTASTLISSQSKNQEVAFEALIDLTNAMFDWKVPAPVSSKVDKISEINPYKEYALDTIKKSMEISRGFNNLPEQNELGGKQWELLDLPIISNNNGKGNLNINKIAEETQTEFKTILK